MFFVPSGFDFDLINAANLEKSVGCCQNVILTRSSGCHWHEFLLFFGIFFFDFLKKKFILVYLVFPILVFQLVGILGNEKSVYGCCCLYSCCLRFSGISERFKLMLTYYCKIDILEIQVMLLLNKVDKNFFDHHFVENDLSSQE